MADISKCCGLNCPLREHCYRFKAQDSHWQSYFRGETGLTKDKDKCENYIAASEYRIPEKKVSFKRDYFA